MAINKIFFNPTVKQVIFQIQYANLFFLESRIPEIQMDILRKFPASELIVNQSIAFFNNNQLKEENDMNNQLLAQKVWQFSNPDGYTLGITNNSLSITSTMHKTYNNKESQNKFRDIIEFCVSAFEKHIKLPFVNRVGLRYIDECPLFDKTTNTFNNSFNSAINTDKFPIEVTEEYYFKSVKNVGEYNIIYQELLTPQSPGIITLDFDGFAMNIEYDNIMETSDKLHNIISSEFENSIKSPIIDYMEGKKNENKSL